jgi:uncharacterized protein (DUF1330 family)
VNTRPVTLCVLLWAREGQAAALTDYENDVLPLLIGHGATVLQRAQTRGERDEPNEIQVIQFPSEAALDAYIRDPRRAALAEERELAIERTQLMRVDLV